MTDCDYPRIVVRALNGKPDEIVAGARYVANLEHPDGSVEMRVGIVRANGGRLEFDIGRKFPLEGGTVKVHLVSRIIATMLGP